MFKKLKNIFKRSKKVILQDKDKATARGEAYVRVLNVNFDPENPGDGYFELEWNQIFIKQLLEAGYSGKDEEEIIDSWFTNLCRNIAEDVG